MMDTAARILIVDDEPPLLRMMSLYLGRKGYIVAVAMNAVSARAELSASPGGFRAVVLDATMAGVTLAEFGGEILDGNPETSLLVVSGYPVDMSRLEEWAPERVAFLHKPFAPEMLATALRRLIGSKEESV
jgi:DNA-binding NtrC family response regulator